MDSENTARKEATGLGRGFIKQKGPHSKDYRQKYYKHLQRLE